MRRIKYLRIPVIVFFLLIRSINLIYGQTCTPTTTNGASQSCVEGGLICVTPYIYNYNSPQFTYPFQDLFNSGSIDGWQPNDASTSLVNSSNRLAVSKANGGAYKNFNALIGQDYSLELYIHRGNCNPSSNITVNVKDINNNVVSAYDVTNTTQVNSGGYSIVNIQFTTLLTGNYTIEIIKTGNNSNCTFYIDNVILKYADCSNNISLWHHFYVDNSGITSLTVTDNLSGFVGAKIYGPFSNSKDNQVCDDIATGLIPPIIDNQLSSGNVLNLASNLNSGWYILEVIDNDCLGCIEIDVNEGSISCGPNCPDNSSCEDIQKLCDNTIQTAPCACVNNSSGGQIWYEFDITNINQILDVTALLQPSGNPTNFNYGIAGPLSENYSCDIATLQTQIIEPNGSGNTNSLSFNQFPSTGTYILVLRNSCNDVISDNVEFNISFTPELDCTPQPCPTYNIFLQEEGCIGEEINFELTSTGNLIGINYTWNFGDGTTISNISNPSHIYTGGEQFYTITVTIDETENCPAVSLTQEVTVTICDPPCDDCIGSFNPIPGEKYVLSAWLKEADAPLEKTTYDKGKLELEFYTASHQLIPLPQPLVLLGSGMIIDGWQRIEEEFTIPPIAAYVNIKLIADGDDVYFDDIRVFPFDASMKSYVYDPVNMRLVAELDERHYATFYEYDEEGKLIRIKKETEKGIMTIQETRNSTSK
jgi:PKD domain